MPFKNIEITPPSYSITQPKIANHVYKGFSTTEDFSRFTKLYDFDLVKQDIFNHFNTRKGERLMNPLFGSIIWDLIFEPLTPQIREILLADVTSICKFDPRVSILEIKVNEYEQGYLVEITLKLKTTNQVSNLKVAFDQKLGLVVQ